MITLIPQRLRYLCECLIFVQANFVKVLNFDKVKSITYIVLCGFKKLK